MSAGVAYVLGTESSGKTDLVQQLEYLCRGLVRAVPATCTPTAGQEVTELQLRCGERKGRATVVEVRELGGSLANAWESFIGSRKLKDSGHKTKFVLLFVVDAAAPHQLPLASAKYRYLTEGGSAVCAGWPTLLVVQKCACPGSMTLDEVVPFFVDSIGSGPAPQVLAADSWNGVGIGDVFHGMEAALGGA